MCVHVCACMCSRPPSLQEQAVFCAYRSPQCRGLQSQAQAPASVASCVIFTSSRVWVCVHACSWSLSCLLEALGQACEDSQQFLSSASADAGTPCCSSLQRCIEHNGFLQVLMVQENGMDRAPEPLPSDVTNSRRTSPLLGLSPALEIMFSSLVVIS